MNGWEKAATMKIIRMRARTLMAKLIICGKITADLIEVANLSTILFKYLKAY